jgi:glycosyltransferase involved in cell wall biosynthesis
MDTAGTPDPDDGAYVGSLFNRRPAVESSARLRVLFFATRDWYHPATTGGDITMWEFARYLASVGHRVTFVAAGFPEAAKRATLDGITVVRLRGIHSLWLLTFVYYMVQCRGKYDAVVTEGFGGSRIPRMAPLYVKEPIITEWHQIHRDLFAAQYPSPFRGPLNLLERITARVHRDTLVRAGTKEWQQAFPRIGFKPENVFLIPVSIREEWLMGPNGSRVSEPTIVWLGKFRRYKCPHHAVLAMSEVTRKVPGAQLILAGRHDDWRYENDIEQLVKRLGLEKSVELRFNLVEVEKRNLLRSSRAMVLPSAVEGFGIVVLEANACGVPVIASSGVPEGAVRDGYNGLRYPFADIRALADAMARTLTDDELHDRLSGAALDFAQKFNWRHVGAQFEQLVEQAARRGAVAP